MENNPKVKQRKIQTLKGISCPLCGSIAEPHEVYSNLAKCDICHRVYKVDPTEIKLPGGKQYQRLLFI